MIDAWRLVSARHATLGDAFSGDGARLFGGRWNSPGVAVIYVSGSLALAALETLAHADRRRFERRYVAYRLTFPERQVLTLAEGDVPDDWRDRPVSVGARRVGDGWVREAASAALSVPSVLVPLERNLVLNPAHPDFKAVEIEQPLEFVFDARLA
ncbi:MAG: RES family NAD+ phosphorylase [Trueperaceae bacterium]